MVTSEGHFFVHKTCPQRTLKIENTFVRYVPCIGQEIQAEVVEPPRPLLIERAIRFLQPKSKLLLEVAMTNTRDNDTSVTRGSTIKKVER